MAFSEDALTGTANLAYQWTKTLMTYVIFSRGYKAGGYNLDRDAGTAGGVVAPKINPIRFRPETAESTEAGIRSSWFKGQLIANRTFFYMQFYDYQLNTFGGLGFTISNAGSVHAKGFELETVASPVDGLLLNAAATFSEAVYGARVFTPGYHAGATGPGGNVCGITPAALGGNVAPAGPRCLQSNTITQAPKWTLTGGGRYEMPLEGLGWKAFIDANIIYRSHYNTGSDLDPEKVQDGFALVNGRIGVRTEDGRWEVSVWGRNIFDRHYKVVGFDSVAQSGSSNVFPGEPATYGATVAVKLDREPPASRYCGREYSLPAAFFCCARRSGRYGFRPARR